MRLLGRTGPVTGRTVTIAGRVQIGRAPECQLQIAVDGVSRQHAAVTEDGQTCWVEDLDSANGTYLNGQRIKRERLAHLDVISLGLHVDLIVDGRQANAPLAGAAPGADVLLETIEGPGEGTRLVVDPGEVTIGRVAPANVLLESRVVSKLHARIRRSGDSLSVDDLDSANGTFVNGTRIHTNQPLHDGDTLGLGGVVTYRIHLSGASKARVAASPLAPAAAPAPATPPVEPAAASTFNQEWKTRLIWSPEELTALEAERARIVDEVRRQTGGLPGGAPAPAQAPGSAPPAPARGTEFLDRANVPLPPEIVAAPVAATPIAPSAPRATEFLDRGALPLPPVMEPAPFAPAPPAPVAPPSAPHRGTEILTRDQVPLPPEMAPPANASSAKPTPAASPAAEIVPIHSRPTEVFRTADFAGTAKPAATPAPAGIVSVRIHGTAGEFVLTPGTHVVGRQEGIEIRLADRQVSRKHALVIVGTDRVSIEDNNSANGTSINGARIKGTHGVTQGDRVMFGETTFTIDIRRG